MTLKQALGTAALTLGVLLAGEAKATETEDNGIAILPVAKPVNIDGKFDEWNLTGGMFVCHDVERARDRYSYWVHLMYDQEHLYVLTRVRDATPLSNQGVVGVDHGFRDDALQFRCITGYKTPQERVAHLTCWQGKGDAKIIEIVYGRDFKGGNVRDALAEGAQMALRKDDDGLGYVQEIALPRRLLANEQLSGTPFVITFEQFFAPEMSTKDNFRPGVTPDRVFTFRAYDNWGFGSFETKPDITPRPVRLADGREFAVRMEKGIPVVDWTGLDRDMLREGFKEIAFQMPFDGQVSMNIVDEHGKVVRQMLGAAPMYAGRQTVKWDGLGTPLHRAPGDVLPAGKYRWRAIAHPGISMKLRGWASNSGNPPWDAGKTANWGGDHGVPYAVAVSDAGVYLGWTGAEAGKALVATDFAGKVRWRHIRGGMGGAGSVAVLNGIVYVVDHENVIYRLDEKTGEPSFWPGLQTNELTIQSLGGTAAKLPTRVIDLSASNGKLYLAMSSPPLLEADVKDAAALSKRVLANEQGIADAMDAKLKSRRETLAKAGKSDTPLTVGESLATLNRHLNRGPSETLTQRRDGLVKSMPEALSIDRPTSAVAIVDATSGKLDKVIPIGSITAIAADGSANALVITEDGTRVASFDLRTGNATPLVQGLVEATRLTTDASANVYVSVQGSANEVRVYDRAGKPLRTIGKPGGRAPTGVWDAPALYAPAGVAIDREGRLWVAEAHNHPKRYAVFNASDGSFVKDFHGPSHYGSSGATIYPRDPNVMVGEGCEWRIDPATGQASITGVFKRGIASYARFARAGDRDYLVLVNARGSEIEFLQRLGEGDYRLRGRIAGTTFWADANDDQTVQPQEVQEAPYRISFAGYLGWSAGIGEDLTLFGTPQRTQVKRGERAPDVPDAVLLRVSGFTACGAPRYNPGEPQLLPSTPAAVPSRDNAIVLTSGSDKNPYWRGIDVATGKERFAYANLWHGVHGSHRAPAPEPGLLRGTFGAVGSATLPSPVGRIWAINSNVGEWHVLTEEGFYLTRLFQGDPTAIRWPKAATVGVSLDEVPAGAGAEDFGGSLIQGDDGKVYLQAGKVALWNIEVTGFENVRSLGGAEIVLSEEDVEKARRAHQALLQDSAGGGTIVIREQTAGFTGDLDKDFAGQQIVAFSKSPKTQVRAALAYDAQHLYAGWHVKDDSPWVNGADAPEYLYARGDTVDLQLGTAPDAERRKEPVAGDLRLSIGNFSGKPTAVLYRPVATKEKAPKVFSSGVVAEYRVELVKVLTDVEIKLTRRNSDYVVEAKIPLATLELPAALRGVTLAVDLGATHGDGTGTDTALRTYWSDQQTGLVSDEVFELKPQPANWGRLRFE